MDLSDLAALAARELSPSSDGVLRMVLPKLTVFAQPRPSQFEAALFEPVLIVVLQGRKETVLGGETYAMGPGDCLLVSHDLPLVARVTKAPYLAVLFDLDLAVLRELFVEIPAPKGSDTARRALSVQRCDAVLVDALARYLALARVPADAAVLGPLVMREAHYRLATAAWGGVLRSMARRDSHASAIGRAIATLRRDFRSTIEVPSLARSVGMSPASFHRHFKAMTASSPLQFQKDLRLLEARRRLRSGAGSVSATAFEVGYESPTQFSREYGRKFGVSPKEDAARAAAALLERRVTRR